MMIFVDVDLKMNKNEITKNILVFVIERSSERNYYNRMTSVGEVQQSVLLFVRINCNLSAHVYRTIMDEIQYNCHSCRYSKCV